MTTRRADGRSAVSHVRVLERLATRYGTFTLVEVGIETGRTHQIRVHMQALGHPVVGDTLYGAPRTMMAEVQKADSSPFDQLRLRNDKESEGVESNFALERNFLHAAHLEFAHPQTGKTVAVDAALPAELEELLARLRAERG
jgi:23S rRNA pseudouridine1911/1915/1917 synthase